MNREAHVRLRERLWGRLPRSTRLSTSCQLEAMVFEILLISIINQNQSNDS
jgi:hypothetical protein